MKKYTQKDDFTEEEISNQSILEEIARRGAQKMLQMALENEIQEYVGAHNNLVDENNKRIVVRNGYLPERGIASGIGSISIKQPRARIRNRDL